jgi:hypothetical protein
VSSCSGFCWREFVQALEERLRVIIDPLASPYNRNRRGRWCTRLYTGVYDPVRPRTGAALEADGALRGRTLGYTTPYGPAPIPRCMAPYRRCNRRRRWCMGPYTGVYDTVRPVQSGVRVRTGAALEADGGVRGRTLGYTTPYGPVQVRQSPLVSLRPYLLPLFSHPNPSLSPHTLNPKSQAEPPPETRNPKPETRNRHASTLLFPKSGEGIT